MSRAIRRCLLRSAQDLGLLPHDLIRNNPASMPGIKSRQTFRFKTLLPARNKLRAASFQKHDPLIRLSHRQPQNYPGTARIAGFYLSRASHLSKHSPFVRSQFQAFC